MSGLLLRDWYGCSQILKSVFWLEVFSVAFSLLMKNNTYGLMTGMVCSASILLSFMALDEKGGWGYLLCTPVSRAQVVGEKYLFSLLIQAALLAVNGAIGAAVTLWYGLGWEEFFLFLLISAAYYFYIGGVILPLCLKWGTERARYLILVVLLVPFLLLGVGFLPFAEKMGEGLVPQMIYLPVSGLLLFFFLFWAGSYFLSLKIFRKKEIS